MKPSTKMRIFQLSVLAVGLVVLMFVDWRIIIGVFLLMYADNLGELVQQMHMREKYREIVKKGG